MADRDYRLVAEGGPSDDLEAASDGMLLMGAEGNTTLKRPSAANLTTGCCWGRTGGGE